jgi:hypothetical protein
VEHATAISSSTTPYRASAAICHTINPRLFPEQIAYIANHADDRYVFFDLSFAAWSRLSPRSAPVSRAGSRCAGARSMPANAPFPNLHCYEDLMAAQSDDFEWPRFDENTASSCATPRAPPATPRGALFASFHAAARLRFQPARRTGRIGLRLHPARRADVPCQCLGPAVCLRADRRQAGAARDRTWTAPACTRCSRKKASPCPPACRPSGSACCSTCRATSSR